MGPLPEPQPALPVLEKAPDPLQGLWDHEVADYKTNINLIKDLCARAEWNFWIMFDTADVARHDDHHNDCGLKKSMSCSCCKGALTLWLAFEEAKIVLWSERNQNVSFNWYGSVSSNQKSTSPSDGRSLPSGFGGKPSLLWVLSSVSIATDSTIAWFNNEKSVGWISE